jgi:hypothetical protein
VVFDHLGGAMAAVGFEQRGFPDRPDLPRSSKAWVKISTGSRVALAVPGRPDYAGVAPFAKFGLNKMALHSSHDARITFTIQQNFP